MLAVRQQLLQLILTQSHLIMRLSLELQEQLLPILMAPELVNPLFWLDYLKTSCSWEESNHSGFLTAMLLTA